MDWAWENTSYIRFPLLNFSVPNRLIKFEPLKLQSYKICTDYDECSLNFQSYLYCVSIITKHFFITSPIEKLLKNLKSKPGPPNETKHSSWGLKYKSYPKIFKQILRKVWVQLIEESVFPFIKADEIVITKHHLWYKLGIKKNPGNVFW